MDSSDRSHWAKRYIRAARDVSNRAKLSDSKLALEHLEADWCIAHPEWTNNPQLLSTRQEVGREGARIKLIVVDHNDLGHFGTQRDTLIDASATASYVDWAGIIVLRPVEECDVMLGRIQLHEAFHAYRDQRDMIDKTDERMIGQHHRRYILEEVLAHSLDRDTALALGGPPYRQVITTLAKAYINLAQKGQYQIWTKFVGLNDYPPPLDKEFGHVQGSQARSIRRLGAAIHAHLSAIDKVSSDPRVALERKILFMATLITGTQ